MAQFPPLVQALLDPRTYPHQPFKVELVQTQMSFIFLTGKYVYKVKKPVNLGYLDYTTLEKRRFFCYQELKLNRRLCPDIYLDVLPIVQRDDNFYLGAEENAVEYAVKMRQLPSDRMMDALLRGKQVSPQMVQKVAHKLADFHRQAETSAEISHYGGLDTVLTNTEENFSQTREYIGRSTSSQQYRAIKAYTDLFLHQNAALFEKRVKEGRVKDCHGDLHAAHICFSNGICIYDCIEFKDRFRYCDVASEIAFLAMDLDFHGHPHLSYNFTDAYVEISQDRELLKLLHFYKCYRAYVRGKVEGFKLDDPHISEEEKTRVLGIAKRYFALAHSYAKGLPRPSLFITAGLVGTGKTSLAQGLASRTGIEVISSDIVRKRLANIPPTEHRLEPFEKGLYSEDFSRRTYDQLFSEARQVLAQGRSVILDASFKRREARLRAKKLSEELASDFWVIECVLSDNIARERLEQRLREGSVSNGRWEIWEQQKKDFDPVAEVSEQNHIILDTSQPLNELVELAMEKVEKGANNEPQENFARRN